MNGRTGEQRRGPRDRSFARRESRIRSILTRAAGYETRVPSLYLRQQGGTQAHGITRTYTQARERTARHSHAGRGLHMARQYSPPKNLAISTPRLIHRPYLHPRRSVVAESAAIFYTREHILHCDVGRFASRCKAQAAPASAVSVAARWGRRRDGGAALRASSAARRRAPYDGAGENEIMSEPWRQDRAKETTTVVFLI